MKILIDARESGTSTGRYIDKLIEYLHMLQSDHEFIVLTKSPRVDYLKKAAPSFKVIESNFKEFSFSEQLGFLHQLSNQRADLVHFGMTQQPILYGGKVITTIHDLTTIRFDNPAKNKIIYEVKQQIYKRVIKRVAKKSAYIITPSEYVKSDVAQYANIASEKIFVTYEAADRIRHAGVPVERLKNKQFIMYVGRATTHKNLDKLTEAFIVLRKKHPKLMLVLAGKMDANYRQLEAEITAKRLADAVMFTNYVSEGELKWLYMNAAAYVFPSLSEGFGLPGLEAMVHGAPVVASQATCLPEIYGKAAHYFDPTVVYDIASKINDVLINAELRDQLIQNGRRQAAKYSWQKMAEQTLKIYDKSLDG